MAASSYSSTEETTNACRACRLLLGPCTDQLRDVLRHYIPPAIFPRVVVQKRSNLPRLTAPQTSLILPRGKSYTGNYDDMDISLLYTLLRNICSIPPHRKGCGNDPDPTDRSLSANIERIRIARNQCVHSSSPVLSNADFNIVWSTVRSAVMDLDSFLNNCNQYEKAVDFLKHETMDPIRDLHFIEELRKQAEEDATTRKILHGLQRKLEESEENRSENQNKILETINEIKNTKCVIPPNVKDIHSKKVLQWKKDDEVFIETHNFHAMLDKVRNQPYMTFVGVPGSGKSATIHHIALTLQEKKYEVVPIEDIRKIEHYTDSRYSQVFVVDDVVGILKLQKPKLKSLMDYEEQISNPFNENTKVLMSCREAVFNECYKSFFINEKHVIKLSNPENMLNEDDKKSILQIHGLDRNLLPTSFLKETSYRFPLLCKLYSKVEKFRKNAENFFTCPVECILEEFEKMKCHYKLCYATLVLLMLNDRKLSKKSFLSKGNNQFYEMKSKVIESCEVESNTDAFKFVRALSVMEGTYTKLCGSEYTFIQESMYEIMAYHFGCQCPDIILQYISSSYIAKKVEVKECKKTMENGRTQVTGNVKDGEEHDVLNSKSGDGSDSFDLCIRLGEDKFLVLAERLYSDIENLELYDVFMNDVLKQSEVCKLFIEVLNRKSYSGWKALFLSKQNDVHRIVRKINWVVKECEESEKRSNELRKQNLLVNERWTPLKGSTYSVRVISWVVYYGHNKILQHILEQTDRQNETHSQMFDSSIYPVRSFVTEESEKNIPANDRKDNPCILNTSTHSGNEELVINQSISEQHRLLVLGCYSGDLETVRILIKYVSKSTINKELRYLDYDDRLIVTPLTAACTSGQMTVVKELLDAGADLNPQGKYDTPLTVACRGGYTNVVKELIKSGAEVNPQGKFHTPLTAACTSGNASVVMELIKAEADINPEDKYNTPLTASSKGGFIHVVKELIKVGANVNLRDQNDTALTAACYYGHKSIVKELIKAGADVNLEGKYHTPLSAACERGHVGVVKELIDKGADVNLQRQNYTLLIAACQGGYISVVKELIVAGADVNQQTQNNTPLKAACQGGHLNVVNKLIEAGANINPQTEYNTPLTAASEGGHISVVKMLLEEEADVNPHGKYNLPLTAACRYGHLSVLKELLEAGADVNPQRFFNLPLTEACKNGHLCVVKELIKAGADINPQCTYHTPLTMACKRGHTDIVKELLDVGADRNPQGKYHTPLTAACKDGHVEVVKELIEAEADVNLQEKYHTPLTAACNGGHLNVVKELLEAEADANIQGQDDTPLTAACRGGYCSVVNELIEVGADINMQDSKGRTPIYTIIFNNTESLIPPALMVNDHGADATICNNEGLSALSIALVEMKIDVVKELVQTEREGQLNKRKLHLFESLVNIRNSDVITDSKDNVVMTHTRVRQIDKFGDLYKIIKENKCDVLKNLFHMGLDFNQWIQLYYEDYESDFDEKPLLFSVIDEGLGRFILIDENNVVEMLRTLLEAGTDVNVRVRYREYNDVEDREGVSVLGNAVLDREGVSVLERTRRLVKKFKESKFKWKRSAVQPCKRVLSVLKNYVRRYSV
ncbi:uncharacterized protein LOC134236343 [Saccostrea cucullata]|uniref:uncharacterized protein LOC134236343 n=1 Tax=Saccostrea cuccullata TaxID=36930 RepID=UPI002ED4C542